MQLDSLIVIFMVEAIAGLLLLATVTWFFYFQKKRKDKGAAISLIAQVNEGTTARNQELAGALKVSEKIAKESIEGLLSDVISCEKALYQQIIKLFINRDNQLLSEIDQRVRALSEPYCHFISKTADNQTDDTIVSANDEQTRVELERMRMESDQLSQQLMMAMETVDNVSNEYANLFQGTRSAEELEESRLKMLNIYKEGEKKIVNAFQPESTPESDDDLVINAT